MLEKAPVIFAVVFLTSMFAYIAIAQGGFPADAVLTPEFNFVLTQDEKDFITTNYPNLVYSIEERGGAWTSFVLNGTLNIERPDLSVRIEDYVNSHRPVYNSTGSAFDCEPTLVQGVYVIKCLPR